MRSPEVGDIWKAYLPEFYNDAHILLIVKPPKRFFDRWEIGVVELNGPAAGLATEWVMYDNGLTEWEKVV